MRRNEAAMASAGKRKKIKQATRDYKLREANLEVPPAWPLAQLTAYSL